MEPDDNTITITTLNGVETIDLGDTLDTTGDIVIDYNNVATDWSVDSTVDTISDGTFTIDTNSVDWLNDSNITIQPTMWEDCMPDPQTLKKMCEQYPALEKAYENFRAVYSMVEQDWKGNHEDDEPIF